jgi:hypothetical protein
MGWFLRRRVAALGAATFCMRARRARFCRIQTPFLLAGLVSWLSDRLPHRQL